MTAAELVSVLGPQLSRTKLIVVANREPYIHVKREPAPRRGLRSWLGRRVDGNALSWMRPASGLVTALDPVMRACGGTWIAHGSGSGDREAADERGRVAVPPDDPSYTLRRVWLTQEEEEGYYYGLANNALWPLCHIAYARPEFDNRDWEQYRRVNQRFANTVIDEIGDQRAIVFVQDYHFALLPRLVKEALPETTVCQFWHIPWPNSEAFRICPWAEEIVDGLLGNDLLGFHIQSHCNNFFDTVDRYLEARVDRETFTISCGGEPTEVHRYPISIEWPLRGLSSQPPVPECRRAVREALKLAPDVKLGVGVDRLDYTKGILERFAAIERLLEKEPAWIGKLSFLQVAAPSRASIDEYQSLDARVRAAAARINARFASPGCQPIILRIEHHDSDRVYTLYRAADFCFVSSLHDGMNLVAKEFVATREDERGVLILSQFAGAARDLPEALIVNPYDTEQCAAAVRDALVMSPDEQRARMRSMRALLQEFNVYRWAGRMLLDAARMRNRRRLAGGTRPVAPPSWRA